MQWGLEYQTLKFPTHSKTESFNLWIWDGFIFKWSFPVHRQYLKFYALEWTIQKLNKQNDFFFTYKMI